MYQESNLSILKNYMSYSIDKSPLFLHKKFNSFIHQHIWARHVVYQINYHIFQSNYNITFSRIECRCVNGPIKYYLTSDLLLWSSGSHTRFLFDSSRFPDAIEMVEIGSLGYDLGYPSSWAELDLSDDLFRLYVKTTLPPIIR